MYYWAAQRTSAATVHAVVMSHCVFAFDSNHRCRASAISGCGVHCLPRHVSCASERRRLIHSRLAADDVVELIRGACALFKLRWINSWAVRRQQLVEGEPRACKLLLEFVLLLCIEPVYVKSFGLEAILDPLRRTPESSTMHTLLSPAWSYCWCRGWFRGGRIVNGESDVNCRLIFFCKIILWMIDHQM